MTPAWTKRARHGHEHVPGLPPEQRFDMLTDGEDIARLQAALGAGER